MYVDLNDPLAVDLTGRENFPTANMSAQEGDKSMGTRRISQLSRQTVYPTVRISHGNIDLVSLWLSVSFALKINDNTIVIGTINLSHHATGQVQLSKNKVDLFPVEGHAEILRA